MLRYLLKSTIFCLLTAVPALGYAVTTHTSDFIADHTRAYFNGFEGLPDTPNTITDYVYIEDNIRVEQVVNTSMADQFPEIWVANLPDGPEGNNAWYPNAGDYGYTMITLADGSDFTNIGLLAGSGGGLFTKFVMYALYNNGDMVASGHVDFVFDYQYLGFSDVIFDTLLLRDTRLNPDTVSFLDANINALSIDSIEVSSVPVPPAVYLFGAGLLVLSGISKQRQPAVYGARLE